MKRRGTHPGVYRYCEQELLRRSVFQFEATKGLAQRLRDMTGLTLDGSELVDACFSRASPAVTFNAYVSKSDASEHSGFANLQRGVFETFRNPIAHAPRMEWTVSEEDAWTLLAAVVRAPPARLATVCTRLT